MGTAAATPTRFARPRLRVYDDDSYVDADIHISDFYY